MYVRWGLTLVFWIIAGICTSRLLDRVLFEVSYDYVYSPGYFERAGFLPNLLISTFNAAVVTQIRHAEKISIGRWVRTMLLCVLIVPLTALGAGLAAGLISKFQGSQELIEELAPVPRVFFCEWLIRGTVAGVLVGSALFLSLIYELAGRAAQISAGSRSDPLVVDSQTGQYANNDD